MSNCLHAAAFGLLLFLAAALVELRVSLRQTARNLSIRLDNHSDWLRSLDSRKQDRQP
jgi:hypothetical protein